jgi:zinc transporter
MASDFKKLTESNSYAYGFVLDGKGGGIALERADSSENPYWCHLDFLEEDCRPNLVDLGIPEHAIDSITRTDSRPRCSVYEDGILLILRVVNMNPGEDPNDMVSLRFWIEKNKIITLRQKRVLSAQDVREEIEKGTGPKNTSEVLTYIIERVADRVSEYVDGIESRMELFEDSARKEDIVKVRANVARLRREAAMVRRYLAPQREALEALFRQSTSLLNNDDRHYLQELSDRIIRYVEDLDLVREKAVVLQEELMNLVAQQQNDRMYVLSIIAAIFLPISFVTGLFGMNIAGLPGIEEPSAFGIVALAMAVMVSGILIWFRLKKWL